MDRPQLIRCLRIAVSVFFAVVTVALCVLWVRSFWTVDIISVTSKNGAELRDVMSGCGVISFHNWTPLGRRWAGGNWQRERMPVQRRWIEQFQETRKFQLSIESGGWGIDLPYWSFVIAVCFASVIPWARTCFSLRTLLIATTIVAVVLGLGVWAAR